MRFMLTERVPVKTAAQREITLIANRASKRLREDARAFPHVPKPKAVKVKQASYVKEKLAAFGVAY